MNIFTPTTTGPALIGAHRGFRSIRPENSLAAFEASLGHCHFIELDIQMSRDGIAIVTHDEDLGRTCNATEIAIRLGKTSLRVDDWDMTELRQLDFGSWFLRTDPFGTIQDGTVSRQAIEQLPPQRLMTLKELLAWQGRVQIPLNIEIKDQLTRRHDTTIVEAVLTAIHEAGCQEQIIISSFRHDYLREIHQKAPRTLIGALQEGRHPDNLIAYLTDLGAHAYHPDLEITTLDLIHELRGNGFGVNIFTVNDPSLGRQLLQEGATAVFTDYPSLSSSPPRH